MVVQARLHYPVQYVDVAKLTETAKKVKMNASSSLPSISVC